MKAVIDFLVIVISTRTLVDAAGVQKEFNINQHDYDFKFGRSELLRYNKNLIKYFSIVTYKYNRTMPVVNATTIANVGISGEDLEVVVQVYKFMSNEYRLFPIHFEVNAEKALNANMLGVQRLANCGNFTGFPLIKNMRYDVCNFYPDQAKLPPLVPSGDYKIEIQAMFHSNEAALVALYGAVTRPIG